MFYGVDPAGQGYSPYGYAGNNPVIFTDRDGRIFGVDDAIIIGSAVFSAFVGATHADQNGQTFWEGLGYGALKGAVSGFVGGGVSSLFGQVNGLWANVGVGVVSGASSGAVSSAMEGSNIGMGALSGGITGGIMRGLNYLAYDPIHRFEYSLEHPDLKTMMAVNELPGDPLDIIHNMEAEINGIGNSAKDWIHARSIELAHGIAQLSTPQGFQLALYNTITTTDWSTSIAEAKGFEGAAMRLTVKSAGKFIAGVNAAGTAVDMAWTGTIKPSHVIDFFWAAAAYSGNGEISLVYSAMDLAYKNHFGITIGQDIDNLTKSLWSGR